MKRHPRSTQTPRMKPEARTLATGTLIHSFGQRFEKSTATGRHDWPVCEQVSRVHSFNVLPEVLRLCSFVAATPAAETRMHCLKPRLFTGDRRYLLVDELIHADRGRKQVPGRIVPGEAGVTGTVL
jgi:hypothetical protein